jgi:hypothetical protein
MPIPAHGIVEGVWKFKTKQMYKVPGSEKDLPQAETTGNKLCQGTDSDQNALNHNLPVALCLRPGHCRFRYCLGVMYVNW